MTASDPDTSIQRPVLFDGARLRGNPVISHYDPYKGTSFG